MSECEIKQPYVSINAGFKFAQRDTIYGNLTDFRDLVHTPPR